MNKKEALALMAAGTPVQAWTAANGQYLGRLVKVDGSPWRGTVRVERVFCCAQVVEWGRRWPRRGFRPGETLEVGGVSVTPHPADGPQGFETYVEVLEAALAGTRRHREEYAERAARGVHDAAALRILDETEKLLPPMIAFEHGTLVIPEVPCDRCNAVGFIALGRSQTRGICFGCQGTGLLPRRDPYGSVLPEQPCDALAEVTPTRG